MKIVDSWLNDLPQQFLEKKNIEALIRAFSKQLQEIEDVFDNLKNLTDLDTAAGQNLDMVGTIIPLSRKRKPEYWQVSMLRTLLFPMKDTGSFCGIRIW